MPEESSKQLKPTFVAQKPPSDYEDKIVKFITFLEQMRQQSKCKPLVLMPYKETCRIRKAVEEKFGNNVYFVWHDTTWMNNQIAAIYLNKVFGGIKRIFRPKKLFVWDAFASHVSHDIKATEAAKGGYSCDTSVPGNGIPNGLYSIANARQEYDAAEVEQISHGLEIEAPHEDDTGHVSDASVVEDENVDENENAAGETSDDSDF